MTAISLSAGTLSALCPNAAPEQHLCRGIAYCGKAMNEAIGRAVREEGFRGVFPWAANYDSVEHNNSLARWLRKGLRGKTDDTVRSASRRRLEPADGKALHMAGTSADLTPSPVHSLPQATPGTAASEVRALSAACICGQARAPASSGTTQLTWRRRTRGRLGTRRTTASLSSTQAALRRGTSTRCAALCAYHPSGRLA